MFLFYFAPMIMIQDKIIQDDVISEHFLCNLNACKGACCWEGDYGAPLSTEELHTLERIYEDVKPFLTPEGIKAIEDKGLFTYFKEPKEYGTTLLDNEACAYLTIGKDGIAMCGIEQAYNAGKTDFYKPISCHLYPIRIEENRVNGFDVLTYDRWDICSAACTLGKKEKLPVYKFVKNALVRKYGAAFYEELEAAAEYMKY